MKKPRKSMNLLQILQKKSLEPRSDIDTPDEFEDALREMMETVEECDGEDMDGMK